MVLTNAVRFLWHGYRYLIVERFFMGKTISVFVNLLKQLAKIFFIFESSYIPPRRRAVQFHKMNKYVVRSMGIYVGR